MLNIKKSNFELASRLRRSRRESLLMEGLGSEKISSPWWVWLLPRQLQFTLDLITLVMAFTLSYLLRFDFSIQQRELLDGLVQLPYVVLIQFSVLILTGVYAFIWRYIGMTEVKAFCKAAIWSALPIIALRLLLPEQGRELRVPLSVIVVDTVLAFGGLVALRVVRRAVYECSEKRRKTAQPANGHKKPVLLIGAGRAGILTATEIQGRRGEMDLEIRGFVDDDPKKQLSVIHGVKVLGTTRDLPQLVRGMQIDHVVISMAQATRKDFRRILDLCE